MRARPCEGRGHAFKSRQVHQLMWVVAQLAERCTVTAVVASSSLVSPPKTKPQVQSSNNKFRNCGREVRHLVVNQADDGSSPFSSANASVAKLAQGTCLLSRGLWVRVSPDAPNSKKY